MLNKNQKLEMIEEAVERLSLIKDLHPNVLRDFKYKQKVNYSERTRFAGILYWVDNEERFVKAIKEFEESHDALVYAVTHENLEFGECLTLLYVSKYKEEWEGDKKDLSSKVNGVMYPYAYVLNLTHPEYSEGGSVGLVTRGGGLIRVS